MKTLYGMYTYAKNAPPIPNPTSPLKIRRHRKFGAKALINPNTNMVRLAPIRTYQTTTLNTVSVNYSMHRNFKDTNGADYVVI